MNCSKTPTRVSIDVLSKYLPQQASNQDSSILSSTNNINDKYELLSEDTSSSGVKKPSRGKPGAGLLSTPIQNNQITSDSRYLDGGVSKEDQSKITSLNYPLLDMDIAKINDAPETNYYEYGKNLIPFIETDREYIKFVDRSTLSLPRSQNNSGKAQIDSFQESALSISTKVQQFLADKLGTGTGKIYLDSDDETLSETEIPDSYEDVYLKTSDIYNARDMDRYGSSSRSHGNSHNNSQQEIKKKPDSLSGELVSIPSSLKHAERRDSKTSNSVGTGVLSDIAGMVSKKTPENQVNYGKKTSPLDSRYQGFGNRRLGSQGFGNQGPASQGLRNQSSGQSNGSSSRRNKSAISQGVNWPNFLELTATAASMSGWKSKKDSVDEYSSWDNVMSDIKKSSPNSASKSQLYTQRCKNSNCNKDSSQPQNGLGPSNSSKSGSLSNPRKMSLKETIRLRENPYLRKHFRMDELGPGSQGRFQMAQDESKSFGLYPNSSLVNDDIFQEGLFFSGYVENKQNLGFNKAETISRNHSASSKSGFIAKLGLESAGSALGSAISILPWAQSIKLSDTDNEQNKSKANSSKGIFSRKSSHSSILPDIQNSSKIFNTGFNAFPDEFAQEVGLSKVDGFTDGLQRPGTKGKFRL